MSSKTRVYFNVDCKYAFLKCVSSKACVLLLWEEKAPVGGPLLRCSSGQYSVTGIYTDLSFSTNYCQDNRQLNNFSSFGQAAELQTSQSMPIYITGIPYVCTTDFKFWL